MLCGTIASHASYSFLGFDGGQRPDASCPRLPVAVYALRPAAPVLSLGVLYLFAVLPVAVFFGLRFAVLVSVVSMLTFNWLFLPPGTRSTSPSRRTGWRSPCTSSQRSSVSVLADRARRRAAEAEQQRREAAYAAEVAALLLGRPSAEGQLPGDRGVDGRPAWRHALLDRAGPARSPDPDEQARVLEAGDRRIGCLFFESARAPEAALLGRVIAVLSRAARDLDRA